MDTNISRLANAFLVVAALLILIGLALFVFANSVATLPANLRSGNIWPWAIGPLALRFVASFFVAAGFTFYLVSRRPDYPTLTAFSSIATGFTIMLLLHLLLNLGSLDWSKPLAYAWLIALLVGFVCSLLLLLRSRPKAVLTVPPLPPTPSTARFVAYFILVLTVIVGGVMFLFPDFGRERWPWDLSNPTNVQLLGAIFLSAAISSTLTVSQPSWYGYDLFYPSAGIFIILALLATFMHWSLFDKPLTSWVFVAIYAVSGILAFYTYFRYAFNRQSTAQLQTS